MLKLNEIRIYEDLSEEKVIEKALRKNRIDSADVLSASIVKKSIDARDKNDVHYSYAIQVEVKNDAKYPQIKSVNIEVPKVEIHRTSKLPIVIVGAGPAGLFCALQLAEHGFKPIVVEQGLPVEERIKAVEEYRHKGILNPRCNVQFGEGGAGTFSDGKLTTGINSPLIRQVLETFARFGAPAEVTYLNKPHIGTDHLVRVVGNMRNEIIAKGGEVHFSTHFEDFERTDRGILVHCGDKTFLSDSLVLAIGHSARETFKMLVKKKMDMRRKNFAIGLRIEHKQSMINRSQYGDRTNLKLPSADYKLVYHGKNDRACYSFCMCPGGEVMASSSEPESIVTNGMSCFARDGENANSALLVNVLPQDFKTDDILEGMVMQEKLEHAAFVLAGSNYNAPIQRVEDFEKNIPSDHIGEIHPTYKPGVTLCNLRDILPDYVSQTIADALPYFDRKIKGFNHPDAILTGVETRSSSPLTLLRNEEFCSSIEGVYPCGEGAGYAGGITTAAIDGIKVANAIMKKPA